MSDVEQMKRCRDEHYAFPKESDNWTERQSGMSMRDYFAAKAMQGTLTNPEWNHWSTEQHVAYAYEVADAMLAQRNK